MTDTDHIPTCARSCSSPILLVIFNRPDKAARVFEAIKAAKPPKLFIAADGPRPNRPGEAELCSKTRDIVKDIDWPCEVHTDFLESNVGCDPRVESAITWFFSHVDKGIIFEDDCLPSPDFFQFCDELLAKYAGNEKVSMISGDNFQRGNARGDASYYFSRYANTWGWATWKRVWDGYDTDLSLLPAFLESRSIEKILKPRRERRFWTNFFRKLRQGKYTFWDAKFTFSVWAHDGICIVPNKNLVTNIGHGENATHTVGGRSHVPQLERLSWPLIHPRDMSVSEEADRFLYDEQYHVSMMHKIGARFKSLYEKIKRQISS